MSYDWRVDNGLMLDMLREKGVSRATFHVGGLIASVDFGPNHTSTQHENPNPEAATPARRTTGGRLVPVVPAADSK